MRNTSVASTPELTPRLVSCLLMPSASSNDTALSCVRAPFPAGHTLVLLSCCKKLL
jgi:hypothetical protein